MLSSMARKHQVPVVYVNQFGGNDDLVFDGRSCAFDGSGAVFARGRSFDAVGQTSDPPFRFAARLPSLDDALLFIELEAGAPSGFHAGFWLSTYGLPNDTVAELQRALDETVTRLVEVPAPVAL